MLTDFIDKFRHGDRLFGTLITAVSPKWIELTAGLKLDCIFIDLEHFPTDWTNLNWMCQLCRAYDLPAIVRIPSADPFEACRVLDMGAAGIVAAYIETPEQVQALRSAAKLRPIKGKKLTDVLSGHELFDNDMNRYIKTFNKDHVLLVNIESTAALDRLDDILAVPDLDGVLIGPHDLSCSLGVPEQYDHPRFEKAVLSIIEKVRKKRLGVGMHNLPETAQDIKYGRAGVNLILRLADITLFRNALRHDLSKIRKGLHLNVSSDKSDKNLII